MALTEREERTLRDIACSLRRDDRALARKLGVSTRPDPTAEWLIIAPIAPGLLMAAAGDHWRIIVCAVVGVLLAAAGPPAVSIWLSHHYLPAPRTGTIRSSSPCTTRTGIRTPGYDLPGEQATRRSVVRGPIMAT